MNLDFHVFVMKFDLSGLKRENSSYINLALSVSIVDQGCRLCCKAQQMCLLNELLCIQHRSRALQSSPAYATKICIGSERR